ncbi:MAG: hypothetical protein M3Z25_02710 [Actinomycetota bacterium]|nr:hypothetical protein [Actinomycetota bacterium]
MNTSFDLAAAALRRLDENLTRGVVLPPVDAVIRRADAMNRTTTAATAAVLTVGALGAVTVVAQSVVSGAVPLPIPVALAPATQPALSDTAAPPAVADVLNPGERLVRLNLGVVAPVGSRSAASGATVLSRGVTVRDDQAKSVDVSSSKNKDNKDNKDNDKNNDNKNNDNKNNDNKNNDNKNNDNKNNDNNGGGSGDNQPGNHHGSSSGISGDTTTDGTPKDSSGDTTTPGTNTGTTTPGTNTGTTTGTTPGTNTPGTNTGTTTPGTTGVNEREPNLVAQPTTPKVIRETPDSAVTTTPKTPVQHVRRPSPPTDKQKSPWQEQTQQRQSQQQYFHAPTQIKRDPGGTSGDEPSVVAPVTPGRRDSQPTGSPTSGSTTSESESGKSATGSGEAPMTGYSNSSKRPPSRPGHTGGEPATPSE